MKRLFILIALTVIAASANADFKLWQLAPDNHPVQNMGYVIRTEHGKVIVVDGGYWRDAGMLRDFINERGGVVTSWFVTHYHDDHCGALVAMLDMPNCPKVEKVYMRPVSYEKTKMYEDNGFILRFDAAMAEKKIPVVTPVPGTRLVIDG
ncbi:MAG: MBL fold metallo-hydrolase, partial [Abditibacteriota bacterium]|nr:MBL fold metallo-hydrolase [Abditibacteriota bacterium]